MESYCSDYPQMEILPPLPPQEEKFGDEMWQQPPVQVQVFTAEPGQSNRFWYLRDPPIWLLQVQRDRFALNWHKVKGDEIYPRYDTSLRPRFEQEWNKFQQFISNNNLGLIQVRQWEVTYVNDIPKGLGWESFPEALTLFAALSKMDANNQFLPTLEALSIAGSFVIPDERGRLHFSINRFLRQLDKKEVIQLRLTARGKPQSPAGMEVLTWLDLGRDWVVRGFTDLTSNKAHALWGRKR